jgi:hypothetical protein
MITGYVLIFLGFLLNIVLKWVDVKTNGGDFKFNKWWKDSWINVSATFILILIILFAFPEFPQSVTIEGYEELGERLTYLSIGYSPYLFFKSIIPEKYNFLKDKDFPKDN